MTKYLFSESEIHLVKNGAHEIRNTLKLYREDLVPRVTSMMDIWARCLGYENFQVLGSESKGHDGAHRKSFRLSQHNFSELATALFEQLDLKFSLAKCKWAIAGLLNLYGDATLDRTDVELIERLLDQTIPMPLDERKQRLIELGCLVPDTRPNQIEWEDNSVIVGYEVTELGCYAAGRALERLEKHSLAQITLVKLGLPTELSRLRMVSVQMNASWRAGQRVSSATNIRNRM
jgi:hypothetical protein